MSLPLLLSLVRREARGGFGRMVFFTLCLAIGVGAVVAVAGLADGLDRLIRGEARELLGADVAVEANRPLPPELDRALAALPGARSLETRELATVVAGPPRDGVPGASLLVAVKSVPAEFPFYGRVTLDPPRPLGELLGAEQAVVAPDVLTRLGVAVGGELMIGGRPFRIAGVVLAEPGVRNPVFTIGPRVFVDPAGLARAGLVTMGSRVRYRKLVRLPDATVSAVERVARELRAALPEAEYYEVETFVEAQPALREGLRRVEHFLGLVALLSLLVGGIGVAQAVRAWLASRIDGIAILKCLGVRPREILALYAGQTALLGLAGSLVGAVLGLVLTATVPALLLRGLVPPGAVDPWQPLAVVRGLLLGVGVALVFSVPPLVALRGVPPARVFRRDAEPLPRGRIASGTAVFGLVAGVFGAAAVQSGSARLGGLFTLGLAGATLALAAGAYLVARAVGRGGRRFARVWVRHGLAALARPGAGTLGAIVALGLGVLVVLAMHLVESRLAAQFGAELPRAAPTAFLVDVQPDQWDPLRALLEREGAAGIDSAPVVTGRLASIDGKPVDELARDGSRDRRRRWTLTREQRLTWRADLPPGNVLLAGGLWTDPARGEVSLEEEFARGLGADIGSTLGFEIQGVPVDLLVTSLRRVEWRTFGINFFLVAEPGVLDAAPHFRIVTLRLPREREQAALDLLARDYPNVTPIRVREIVEKVAQVMGQLGLAVRVLGGFTVLAGIAILGGAVMAGSARRGREVALLKTLGMTRGGVAAVFAVEYSLVGFVAGAIGSAGAGVLAWVVLEQGFDLPARLGPGPFAVALAASILLSVLAGLVASATALARRPIEVLRGQ